jgi:pyridinium-3,5-bisthiocarboxylic acid mononucleotide nickel chelatase
VWLGQTEPAGKSMRLIETNIDDMTPELLAYTQETLMAQGAADVWFTSIQMKKNRPAVMLSVLCQEPLESALVDLLLRETSTLGVRVRDVARYEAEREVFEFESSLGPAAVKLKRLPGEAPRVAPEYEVCRRIAQARSLPLMQVYRTVAAEAEAFLRR